MKLNLKSMMRLRQSRISRKSKMKWRIRRSQIMNKTLMIAILVPLSKGKIFLIRLQR